MVRRSKVSIPLAAVLTGVCWLGACARPSVEDDRLGEPVASSAPAAEPRPAPPPDDVAADEVEPATGESAALWSVRTGGEVWSSPVVIDDETVAFGSDDGVLRVVDRETGAERARRLLGGRLRGSPARVGGRLVATSDDGTIYGVDPASGQLAWSRAVAAAVPAVGVGDLAVTVDARGRAIALAVAGGTRRWRGPVGAARGVASDGRRLAVVTTDGVVQGLDAAGRVAWRAEVGAETAPVIESSMVVVVGGGHLVALGVVDGVERWRARVGEFVGAPPAAAAGRVWVATGDGWLLAFDARSGVELWRRRLDGPVRGPPSPAGDAVFLTVGEHRLIGLDAATGDGRWRFDTDAWITGALTAVGDGSSVRVLFGAVDGGLYGVRAELPALDGPPRPAPEVTVGPSFFEGAPAVRWTVDLGVPVQAAPALDAGSAWVASATGLVVLDAAAGRRTGSAASDVATAAPSIAGGLVFHGDLGGTLVALDAVTAESAWRRDLGAPIRSSAVFDGGRLVIATDVSLHALDPRTGADLWVASAGPAPPAVASGLVVGGGCRGVVAYDERGRELWRHDPGGCVLAGLLTVGNGFVAADAAGRAVALEPAVGGSRWALDRVGGVRHQIASAFGTVLLPGDDGHLRGVDAVGGVVRWSFPAGPRVSSDVVVDDGIAYIGSVDGRLYAVNAINGDELWRLVLGAPVRGAAIDAGRLVAVAGDGRVVAVDLP